MPEFRQNIATKEWVIIANERAKRPNDYVGAVESTQTQAQALHDPDCPFCIGNEEHELEVDRIPREGDWQVRTVLNKYPALSMDEPFSRTYDKVQRHITGMGYHEVIVEHPHHNTTLALMDTADITQVFEMFYRRGWGIMGDSRIEQIIFFKNHGKRAGASLKHPHSQLVAMPVVSYNVRQRTEEARRYFDDTGDCVYCVMMRDEMTRRARIVAQSEHFVAFVLYAAFSPFHMWIVPRRHSVSFLHTTEAERQDLAKIVQSILARLFIGLKDPPYNLIIRSAPNKELASEYLHWYVSIVPRLSRQAGFELGSGMYINASMPEECAEFLRDIDEAKSGIRN